MMKRYRVEVVDKIKNTRTVEIHQADSWQSAVLSHSCIGAEFEGLEDIKDLQRRADSYEYYIEVEDLRDVKS